jgi:hypothetical protein
MVPLNSARLPFVIIEQVQATFSNNGIDRPRTAPYGPPSLAFRQRAVLCSRVSYQHAVHEAAAQSLAIRFDEKIDHEIQRAALI